jgi:hypothetical protein
MWRTDTFERWLEARVTQTRRKRYAVDRHRGVPPNG